MRRVGLAVLLAAVVVPGAVWVLEARAAANCLDRGGSYNYSTGQCDFVTSHGRILFASRHGVLLVASAAALLLGISLFARGKGGAALLVIRAASERRALLFCLGVGLLAIALGIVSLAGSLPPSSVGIWGKRGHVFWLAALILSLDVVLVLGGGRGPRGVAIAARTLLLAFLVLLVSSNCSWRGASWEQLNGIACEP